jgi:hypothetical protein
MSKLAFTNHHIPVQNVFSLPLTRSTFMRQFCNTKYLNNINRLVQPKRYNSTTTDISNTTNITVKTSTLVPKLAQHKNALSIPININQQGMSIQLNQYKSFFLYITVL